MKVIDEIRTQLSSKRYPSPIPKSGLVRVRERLAPDLHDDCLRDYSVRIEIGATGRCREEDLPHVKENCIHSIRELLYGELRARLLELEKIIYAERIDLARERIRGLIQELFMEKQPYEILKVSLTEANKTERPTPID